ncbi:HAD family hydrolase [Roseomonas mucosa]|uniref:HAD family hydrolase n=1 Tax=Roseomonas mucosa TaxID=207340 RepID=A0A1S8D940_9PROT|nr:HAD hydrolase-like protein [Roseomonas mucosa]ONH84130.1 HAD family hydrolase [Roseomonas mucosa]
MADAPPAPPYALAAFDFDGTLADSFPWFAGVLNGVADRYGFRRTRPGEAEGLRGLEVGAILDHLGVARWKLPFIARHMRRLAARDAAALPLFPGMDECLRRLSAGGLVLAMVSSNAEATIRRVLGPDLSACIAHWQCGAALSGKPRKLRAVLRRSGTVPQRAILIGDEIRDIRAARAMGMAAGAVGWGYNNPRALREAGPARIFAAPDDIAAFLLPRHAAARQE